MCRVLIRVCLKPSGLFKWSTLIHVSAESPGVALKSVYIQDFTLWPHLSSTAVCYLVTVKFWTSLNAPLVKTLGHGPKRKCVWQGRCWRLPGSTVSHLLDKSFNLCDPARDYGGSGEEKWDLKYTLQAWQLRRLPCENIFGGALFRHVIKEEKKVWFDYRTRVVFYSVFCSNVVGFLHIFYLHSYGSTLPIFIINAIHHLHS